MAAFCGKDLQRINCAAEKPILSTSAIKSNPLVKNAQTAEKLRPDFGSSETLLPQEIGSRKKLVKKQKKLLTNEISSVIIAKLSRRTAS